MNVNKSKPLPRIRFVYLFSLLVLLAISVACNSTEVNNSTSPESPAEVATEPADMAEGDDMAEEAESDSGMDEPADAGAVADSTEMANSADPISDTEATTLMYDLTSPNGQTAVAAIDRILDAKDDRFVAVFIEMMRGAQIGIAYLPADITVRALEELSGQDFRGNWPAWIEWYGQTDLMPPPGFTTWKGLMLSTIDPGFGEFLQDDFESTIRVEEIQWGGVVVDGIPALDQSPLIPADAADYLAPTDAVFGMYINGDARAYPLRIIDWHEMANDVIGGVPVSIAYCTLCGAAVAYDGRASDGTVYDFGSSGFLFRSNKLMYDRQTRTLWNQLTGEPVLGELVGTGVRLDVLPIVLTTWEQWQIQHPDTLVLSLDTGFDRPYGTGAAYGDYFSSNDTMFPVWQRSNLLETKDQIFALNIEGQPKAYPIEILTEEGVVNDELAGTSVVLVASRGVVEVDGLSRRAGPVTYSAGAEVRAYDRGDIEFAPGADEDTVVDTDGAVWQVTEDALVGPDGQSVPRLGGHLAYWFGWYAFFPQTLLYGES